MKAESGAAPHSPSFTIHPSVLIGALFLGIRVPLLALREPFFDELFTRWIAGKPLAGILTALRNDSGPPLYYFLVHQLGDPSVVTMRMLSLVFATISIVMLLRARMAAEGGGPHTAVAPSAGTTGVGPPPSAAVLAPLLLAVFPPAVLLAVDARAYALCALFVTAAVLAVDQDSPFVAALALVAAAYSHYYGVLLFPIILIPPNSIRFGPGSAGVPPANGSRIEDDAGETPALPGRRRRFAALALAILLYIPGFWLALHQPVEARSWMSARWPDALFVQPPLALAIIGAIVLAVSGRLNRYLLMVLVPLALAIALRAYVPMRFEAVVAAPLVLWLAESLRRNRFRLALTTALIAIGAIWSGLGIVDHARRPPDPYRQAAVWVAVNLPETQTVVASGYCYLETVMNGHTRVAAFPQEQADHPGWRAMPGPGVPVPHGAFFWIGELHAPELAILMRKRHVIEPQFVNDRAMVALVR